MSGANENQPGETQTTVTATPSEAPPEPSDEDAGPIGFDGETVDAEQDGPPMPRQDNEPVTDRGPNEEDRGNQSDTTDEAEGQDDVGAPEGWSQAELAAALEAIFFAADDPLPIKTLLAALGAEDEAPLRRALGQMKLEWSGDGRGIHLVEVAGGFQMRTNPTYNEAVLELLEAKPTRLSRAAMETMAIVAYRQPVTKAVVDDIRGVDCGGVLRSLTDVELIAVIGKADDIGRPNLYGTTTRFLEFFGLDSLTGLPTLDDFEMDALELLGEDFDELLAEVHDDDEQNDGTADTDGQQDALSAMLPDDATLRNPTTDESE